MDQIIKDQYRTCMGQSMDEKNSSGNNSLRKCIQTDDELLIWGADNFSQFPRRDASISSKCDRALAIAKNDDLVVLRGNLDNEYQDYLHSHDLGSSNIVEYGIRSRQTTLSEIIVNDPAPIKEYLDKNKRKTVYVPWFSGHMENKAAKVLGADLFGASESETIKYNDKASFKTICRGLNIPVVPGSFFEICRGDENSRRFEEIINRHLSITQTVIIRGTMGEAGMSLYRTWCNDIKIIYRQIVNSGEKVVIIEPYLEVHSSPNDQWVIGRDGTITHIGMCEQICERGMVYIGTFKGRPYNQAIVGKIFQISRKIVDQMACSGYRGVVGIDYIITDEGIFPIENNARFNGSSYAGMIVENLQEKLKTSLPFWKLLKTRTDKCSFSELTTKMVSILYDGIKTACVFPYDCKALSISGNFSILLLAQNMDQLTFLENSLNIKGIKRLNKG